MSETPKQISYALLRIVCAFAGGARKGLTAVLSLGFVFIVIWASVNSIAFAQDTGTAQLALPDVDQYEKRKSALTHLGFGESINLDTGQLSFLVTDVDIPGNSGLKVSFGRRLERYIPREFPRSSEGIGLGEWIIDYPMITQVGGNYGDFQDIPSFLAPNSDRNDPRGTRSFWNGTFLRVPGEGKRSLMRTIENNNDHAQGYDYVTNDNWVGNRISGASPSSDPSITILSPSGVKYIFDHILDDRFDNGLARLAATSVEDVNGNWVKYEYSGNKLTKIYSNDDREILISYRADNTIETVSSHGRIWKYEFSTPDGYYKSLKKVILPDNRYWEFSGNTNTGLKEITSGTSSGQLTVEISDPYGAKIAYDISTIKNGRYAHDSIPVFSYANGDRTNYFGNPSGTEANGANIYTRDVIISSSFSGYSVGFDFESRAVTEKRLYITPTEMSKWSYDYEEDYGGAGANIGLSQSKKRTVIGPDQTKTEHFIYRTMDWKAGLTEKVVVSDSNNNVIKTTTNTYKKSDSRLFYPLKFRDTYNNYDEFYSSLKIKEVVEIDSDIYTSEYEYNSEQSSTYSYGYPISVRSWSSENVNSRGTDTVYEHNTSKWILGLPKEIYEVSTTGSTRLASEYSYTLLGQKESQKRYGEHWADFTYNSDGTMASYTDALGRRTEAHNWHRGKPQLVKHAVGSEDKIETEQVVDDNGWVTSQTDAMNRTTNYTYDDMGRLTQIDPHGNWANTDIAYSFPSSGGAVQTITKGQSETTITYDSMFRPTLEHTQALDTGWSSYINTKYDGLGRVTFKSQPSTTPQETKGVDTTYDGLGRVYNVTETAAPYALTKHRYLDSHRHSIVDPAGQSTMYYKYGYDGPDSTDYRAIYKGVGTTWLQKTFLNKNEYGQLIQLRQLGTNGGVSKDVSQIFRYDSNQRLCSHFAPERGATKYEYDAAGQMIAYAKGQGGYGCASTANSAVRVTQDYDDLGRPTLTDFSHWATPNITRAYDDNGNVTSVYRGTGSSAVNWDYTYNDADLLVSETLSIDGKTFPLSYDYNNSGHLIQEIFPTGRPSDFTVDGLGRPLSLSGWGHTYIKPNTVSYHASGTLTDMEYGNGQIYTKTLNDRLLPERLLTQKPGATALDLTYSYDPNGKITSILDGVVPNNNRSFTYDPLGQLKTSMGPWGTQTNVYDSLGNILSREMTGGAEGDREITLGYDESKNRVNVSDDSQAAGAGWGGTGTGLRAIGYDVRGNVTSLGSMSFYYDTSDRPITVTGSRNGAAFNNSNYAYDGNLKRVKSVINGKTIYNVYSQSGRLMHVEDVTPFDGGLTERTDYIGAGGMSIARVSHGQGRYYLHNDHLGSPVTMAYSTGGIALRTRYTPFGLEMDNHARRDDHAGFTGHIKDSATGLNYMQARYYDPVIGRFLSVDPVGFMQTGNPGMFNRYAYTENDPINFTDPSGLVRCSGDAERCEQVHSAAEEGQAAVSGAISDLNDLLDAKKSGGDLTTSQQDTADALNDYFGKKGDSRGNIKRVRRRLKRTSKRLGERGTGAKVHVTGQNKFFIAGEAGFWTGDIKLYNSAFPDSAFNSGNSLSRILIHEVGHGPGGLRDLKLPGRAPAGLGTNRRAYGDEAARWLATETYGMAWYNNDNFACYIGC